MSNRILFVDSSLLQVPIPARNLAHELGVEVVEAFHADAALEILQSRGPFGLLIISVELMPGPRSRSRFLTGEIAGERFDLVGGAALLGLLPESFAEIPIFLLSTNVRLPGGQRLADVCPRVRNFPLFVKPLHSYLLAEAARPLLGFKPTGQFADQLADPKFVRHPPW